MSWSYSLSYLEITFIALFILFYSLYLIRVYRLSKKMQQPFIKAIPKLIIRTIAFALIMIALLGPSFGDSKKEIKSIGKDIMIAVDLSQSMNATDIAPTRLEKIKFELKNIIEAFNSDRVGLIIFSSEAFVQCPLTFDQGALNLFIETLNTGLVPGSTTDFGAALKLANEKLLEDTKSSQQKSKIIVLISDGEDFGDNTMEQVESITSNDIKLFTLGVGTESGSKIPTRRGFKKDRSGQVVVSKLNSSSLRDIAYETDGEYFEINNAKNEVNRLIATINQIEGELKDSKTIDVSANKYYIFLAAGLLFILIDILISVRLIRI